jgi:MFS family permease
MSTTPTLGLRENWKQFTLLVLVNAFVGGMVGMERSIFPRFAETVFGISSYTAVLSFITAFGFAKAISNYFAGRLANKFGRRNLLILGWILALPIPFMLIHAPSWNWVVAANVLLGVSQGLAWSSTVVMKIDIVGEKNRGLAMGLNEFAGYLAVGLFALLTGVVADRFGVTPYPFYLGIGISVLGLLLTLLFIKDTRTHAHMESKDSTMAKLNNVFMDTTLRDKTLSSVTQAGMVNNFNDGMIWGLLPAMLITLSMNDGQIGLIASIYPIVWGLGQLYTGRMADVHSKKAMLFWGMLTQGLVIVMLPLVYSIPLLIVLNALLGMGTAVVYPTFLTTIAAATHPSQRAESIGVFRLWRDMGYAFGAIFSGITADLMGLNYAIFGVGLITIGSAVVIKWRMPEEE